MHDFEESESDIIEVPEMLDHEDSERHGSEEPYGEDPKFAPRVQTVQVIFKGLMMFHNKPHGRGFEAGIVKVEDHTFTVTVLAKSNRRRREILMDKLALRGHERWEFRMEDPHRPGHGVVEYNGHPFSHQKFDYRFLIDLEDPDFHEGHGCPLNRGTLNPIVTIPYGQVYTHSITKQLFRRKNRDHSFQYFGYAAQEIGFDIRIEEGGSVSLVDGVGKTLFTLRENPNWKYLIEFENSADPVQTSAAHHQGADSDSDDRVLAPRTERGPGDGGLSRALIDHFHYFYRILPMEQPEQYQFKVYDEPSDGEARRPHPSPAICPQSRLSASSIVDIVDRAHINRKREDW